MKIGIVIMGHKKRMESILALSDILDKQPFNEIEIALDKYNDEWETGCRAWEIGVNTDTYYWCVIQDDAIISENFYTNLVNAIQNIPKEGLLSLYLGKVKPHRGVVQMQFNNAMSLGCSYLSCKNLLWGVGFVIPTERIKDVLSASESLNGYLYDTRMGMAASLSEMPVYYTTQSIVDHNDDLGSLTGHNVSQKRCAHKYQPDIIHNWNSKVVKIF